MKYLILIDKKFPYKSGESFLENEIDEISKFFDKILIFPIDACTEDQKTRNIKSNNVYPIIVNKNNLKIRKVLNIIKSLPKILKCKNEKNLRKKIIDSYFMAISDDQTDKILKELKHYDITSSDEVYIYSYWLFTTAMIACNIKKNFLKKNINAKAISRAHRFDIYEDNNKYNFLPRREELLSNLDDIYACSSDGEKYLKEKFNKYSSKIKTGYLGTYDHGLGKSSFDRIIRIVSCSRVTDVKRVNLLIESLNLLKNSNIEIEWTHIGNGPLFERIKELSEQKLSWMKVNLLGYIPNKEVYDYYLNNPVDLFINVSSSEGLPVSIMEAISFGIPVIATDVGGTREIVKNNITGYLIEKNFKIQELADKIKYIYKDKRYVLMRKSTRKEWLHNFQAKENYEKFAKSIINKKNNKEAKVSIIIPTYKRCTYLSRAIESILNQTYKNIEIIVVDDNNPNTVDRKNTEELMKQYCKNKNIIYVKHKKNKNGAAARNTGLKYATGKFVTFLDDDDFFLPNRIKELVQSLLANEKYAAAYTGVIKIYKKRIIEVFNYNKSGNFQYQMLCLKSFFKTGSNMFFRKEILEELGGFDEKFIRHQDIEIMVRFFRKYEILNVASYSVVKDNSFGINKPNVEKSYEVKKKFIDTFKKDINNYQNTIEIYKSIYNILLKDCTKKDKIYTKVLEECKKNNIPIKEENIIKRIKHNNQLINNTINYCKGINNTRKLSYYEKNELSKIIK